MKKKFLYIIIGIVFVLGSFFVFAETRENLKETVVTFNRILHYVDRYYAQEVSLVKIVRAGIKGMLQALDPHSVYLEKKDYKRLVEHTKGKYGGLGIYIGIRDNWLTVVSPIEGTPAYRAGIMAGDKIIKIEGISTKGITTEEASNKMKGKPGTDVTITIVREGIDEEIDFPITRALIEIPVIAYAGIIRDEIGYIRLIQFSENARARVSDALDKLEKEGARKLIIDLRGNPGGLLRQAVEVADNFVEPGQVIVSTKGRTYRSNVEYKGKTNARFKDIPIIVLVDRASASASEIVAGAIQDWDKGIIMGDTTYGKGSVQTVYNLKNDEALKLTTARYYTPSGRCIDRTDTTQFLIRNPTMGQEFQTVGRLKRNLASGGAIIPDIIMKYKKRSALISKLYATGIILKYASRYAREHKDISIRQLTDEHLDEDILLNFKLFMDEKEFEFTEEEFEENRQEIKQRLQEEIANDIFGREGRYTIKLKYDLWIKEAVELMEKSSTIDDLFTHANKWK